MGTKKDKAWTNHLIQDIIGNRCSCGHCPKQRRRGPAQQRFGYPSEEVKQESYAETQLLRQKRKAVSPGTPEEPLLPKKRKAAAGALATVRNFGGEVTLQHWRICGRCNRLITTPNLKACPSPCGGALRPCIKRNQEGRICTQCGQKKQKFDYSKRQWSHRAYGTCRDCIERSLCKRKKWTILCILKKG